MTAAAGAGAGTLRRRVGIVDRPFEQRRDPLVAATSAGAAGHVRGGRRPAERQEHAAAHPGRGARAHPHAARGAVLLPRLRRRHARRAGGPAARRRGGQPARRRPGRAAPSPRCTGIARRSGSAASPSTASTRSRPTGGRRAAGAIAGRRVRRRVPRRRRLAHAARSDFDDLETDRSPSSPTRGLAYGIHVVATADRWAEFRAGDAGPVRHPARAAARRPERLRGRPPGRRERARGPPGPRADPDKLHFLAGLPRIDGRGDGRRPRRGRRATWSTRVDAALDRPARRRRCGCCPPRSPSSGSASWPGREDRRLPLGIDESDLAPVGLDFADVDPHFCVFGDSEQRQDGLPAAPAPTRSCAAHAPDEARLIVVDYRRGAARRSVPETTCIGYATSEQQAAAELVDGRRPVPAQPAARPRRHPRAAARRARWWQGPELLPPRRRLRPGRRRRPATRSRPLLPLLAAGPRRRPAPGR